MKRSERVLKILLLTGIQISALLMSAFSAQAYSANTKILKTVNSASAGCSLIALDGVYPSEVQAALNRINEIRYEACREGVPDPRNESSALTLSDYAPIKWSYSMEYIARARAAEASVYMDHTRPNGTACFTLTAPDGEQSWGEVLAWNSASSMIPGINQWYGEKYDWVNNTAGAVTGHYTQMIDPDNTYVGIGCFLNKNGLFYNTTCGEFSSRDNLSSSSMGAFPDCRVIIEARSANLSNTRLIRTKDAQRGENALNQGDTLSYALGMTLSLSASSTVFDAGNVRWSSSDPAVAAVDPYGNVQAIGIGSAVITAVSDSGRSASVSLNVVSKEKVKSVKAKGRKKSAVISWKKAKGKISGYEIEYSLSKNFTNSKIAKAKKKATSKTIKKLKSKKKYYFRVRFYKKVNGRKQYSAWSAVKKVTVK